MTPIKSFAYFLAALILLRDGAAGFGLMHHTPADAFHLIQTASTALQHYTHHAATTHAGVAQVHHAATHHAQQPLVQQVLRQSQHPSSKLGYGGELLAAYERTLKSHPLPTKMATGATLAVCGDAIAQKSASAQSGDEYDTRRAASFAIFDSAYRALQHYSFPAIVQHCHGQLLGGAVTTAMAAFHLHANGGDVTSGAAAMEQTLASQLGIVPFLYYPAFFSLTAAIQGLTPSQGLTRARDNFLPLFSRNLLFWIPVQFIQFGYVPDDLQIPFLSICGLAWTFILSTMAGSATQKPATTAPEGQPDQALSDAAAQVVYEIAEETSGEDGMVATNPSLATTAVELS